MNIKNIAKKLISGKLQRRVEKNKKKRTRAIKKAMKDPFIQKLTSESGFTEDHLRELYRRLLLIEYDDKYATKGINNPTLLLWFLENTPPEIKFLAPEKSLEFTLLAKQTLSP